MRKVDIKLFLGAEKSRKRDIISRSFFKFIIIINIITNIITNIIINTIIITIIINTL